VVGYRADLSQLATENEYFRHVLYTAKGGQLVVMALKPGEDIGMEVHDDVDQFFWIVQGTAKAVLNGEESEVTHGQVLVVPRGTNHNVINKSGSAPLKLFTVYTPPNHPDGTIHKDKEEAEAAEAAAHH
jgi:mannose-6-phosphate isomerase-like protein (cupin superfamily)